MKKSVPVLLLFLCSFFVFGQEANVNSKQSGLSVAKVPVFPNCVDLEPVALEKCFYKQLKIFVFNNFKIPEQLSKNNYKGTVAVLFEVDTAGTFKVQYVDAVYPELIQESKRVFETLPKVQPSTYNGRPTYAKYTLKIAIPLQDPEAIVSASESPDFVKNRNTVLSELDSIVYKKFNNPQYKSYLNIPFSHSFYAQFDASMNQLGSNNHTGSKPFTYAEVAKYYDLNQTNEALKNEVSGWWGRKIWNENLVEIQGDGYWLILNPIVDFEVGKSNPSKTSYSYINTRGLNFQGGLGSQLNFTTTVFESQGRFADYFNRYAESIKPSGGNPAIIPGVGIAKRFNEDAYDFPLAEADVTFTPNKYIDLQLGYGRNFIGDGYRSLLESDGASPYPYFKIDANFWKIKYTVNYMWLKDVRPLVTAEKTYASKYMANHYLSWNVSNRLNLGFFESVVWTNTNDRGFDMSFVNPIIFYRTVEFTSSSKSGNALLGLTSKYKWNNQINLYGQFLLDEFSVSEMGAGEQSWKNKFGYQLGVKYFNAFQVPNLLLQFEYNHVRPYVYSHSEPITNYGHNNQSVGHPWGGNFEEMLLIGRYHKGRYFADAKFTYGIRGFDLNTTEDSYNYGGDIYKDYDVNRPYEKGVTVGQGNKTTVFIADVQGGFLVNPATNLKLFGSFIYRSFNPDQDTTATFEEKTTWFTLGLRTDIFNWYFDY